MSRRQDRELTLTCPHCGKPVAQTGERCASCGKAIDQTAMGGFGRDVKVREDKIVLDGAHLTLRGANDHEQRECGKCGANVVPVDNKCPYCDTPMGVKKLEIQMKELRIQGHGSLHITGGAKLVIQRKK